MPEGRIWQATGVGQRGVGMQPFSPGGGGGMGGGVLKVPGLLAVAVAVVPRGRGGRVSLPQRNSKAKVVRDFLAVPVV